MPTSVTFPVVGNDDDADEKQDSTGFSRTGTTVSAISVSTGASFRQDVGLRFASVTIPNGAVINSAALRIFIPASSSADDAREHIYAEAVDNSVDFVATASVMSRPNSTANVAWSASNMGNGAYFSSPDIAAVIQEIVNRGGWASGNALTLLLRADTTGTVRTLTFKAKNHTDNQPAQLDVTYASALDFSMTGSGGITFGGVAEVPFTFEMTAAGGITFGGAASIPFAFQMIGAGGITFGGGARFSGKASSGQGATGILIQTPAFADPEGVPGSLPVFEWRTSRYQNRIGTWEAAIPIDEGLIDGEPLHKQIRRGWHVSLLQENNGPNGFQEWYRLYLGVVLERDYEIAEGGTVRLKLSGTFRDQHLADRSTYDGLSYDETPDGIIDDLLDGDNIIGPNDGASYPSNFSTTNLKITFHDISRYAAMIKIAELRRVTLRESWRYDVPEFVRIDGPPDAHVIITNVESEADNLSLAALKGFALVSGTPRVKFRGQDIVNRIVPIGSDTPDGDLTLQYATALTPYVRLSAPKPGGGTYYYIEDTESIEQYGLVEMPLIRTDVKNPSDTFATRQASANVLYAVAVGELLRKKSEAMIVEVDLANGQNIWALPGDAVRLQYTGVAQTDSGTFTWLDEDRYFIVTERHDESTPSGVRNVRFVIAAPEIIMEIPDLPDEVPGTIPTNEEPGDNNPGSDPNDQSPDPGDPGNENGELPDGSIPEILPPISTDGDLTDILPNLMPNCCDDPHTDTEDGSEPPPNIDNPPADLNYDAIPASNDHSGAGDDTYGGSGLAGDIYMEAYYSGPSGVQQIFRGWHVFINDGGSQAGAGDPSWSMQTFRIAPNGGSGPVEIHLGHTHFFDGSFWTVLSGVGVRKANGSIDWLGGHDEEDGSLLMFLGDPPVNIP